VRAVVPLIWFGLGSSRSLWITIWNSLSFHLHIDMSFDVFFSVCSQTAAKINIYTFEPSDILVQYSFLGVAAAQSVKGSVLTYWRATVSDLLQNDDLTRYFIFSAFAWSITAHHIIWKGLNRGNAAAYIYIYIYIYIYKLLLCQPLTFIIVPCWHMRCRISKADQSFHLYRLLHHPCLDYCHFTTDMSPYTCIILRSQVPHS
jgi:hypothetical protein